MAILSIQSHVAYGHVGNRSAVFPLELLGFEVWPINTVQFSNHSGYPGFKGEVFSGRQISLVWSGIRELGVAGECEAVLSGYMGDAETGQAILGAVADVKAASPGALYCCDPVMGDYGKGIYVREGIKSLMRDFALPAADIVTPNQFEAEILAGIPITSIDEAKLAADRIHGAGPRLVLITSFKPREAEAGSISLFLSDGSRSWTTTTPELALDPMPNGAGDLTSALFLGHYLRSRDAAASLEAVTEAVYSVFEATMASGSRELRLIQSRDAILACGGRFPATEFIPEL
jgi:pyridoxine kinase